MSERELPAVPDPPSFGPDPRQEMFYTVIGRLVPALSHPESEVRVAATSTGFPASAVDLGRLQTEIERAFAGWSSKEIRSRWRSDVFPWISRFTRTWVQRRSVLHAKPIRSGIRIGLDTKDDRGYYHYVFEVLRNQRYQKATRC